MRAAAGGRHHSPRALKGKQAFNASHMRCHMTHAELSKSVLLKPYSIPKILNSVVQYGFPPARERRASAIFL
jgi:hypothetical protein